MGLFEFKKFSVKKLWIQKRENIIASEMDPHLLLHAFHSSLVLSVDGIDS